MKKSTDGQARLQRANERMTKAIVMALEEVQADKKSIIAVDPEGAVAPQPAAASSSTTTEPMAIETTVSKKRPAARDHDEVTWSKYTATEATGAPDEEELPEDTITSIKAAEEAVSGNADEAMSSDQGPATRPVTTQSAARVANDKLKNRQAGQSLASDRLRNQARAIEGVHRMRPSPQPQETTFTAPTAMTEEEQFWTFGGASGGDEDMAAVDSMPGDSMPGVTIAWEKTQTWIGPHGVADTWDSEDEFSDCMETEDEPIKLVMTTSGSTRDRHTGTDEVAGPAASDRRQQEAAIPKPSISYAEKSEDIRQHPGQVVNTKDIAGGDKEWKDIGSGTVARSFVNVRKLLTTTRGGPPLCDVHRRTVWSLSTGRVIDDCIVEDTADEVLNRELPYPDDIRVELVLKNALDMYRRKGADVVELYSQPRVAQEAAVRNYGGTNLIPGWSLDLTRSDPQTGKPWNLADVQVQNRVKKMIIQGKPLFVVGSPPCTAFSVIQNINKARRDPKVVAAEVKAATAHINFCAEIYCLQVKSGRYFVHEHPARATSWNTDSMVRLVAMEEVDICHVDMCQYGMTAQQDG